MVALGALVAVADPCWFSHTLDWALFYNHPKLGVMPVLVLCIFSYVWSLQDRSGLSNLPRTCLDTTLRKASFCSSDLLCLALLVQGVSDLVTPGQL